LRTYALAGGKDRQTVVMTRIMLGVALAVAVVMLTPLCRGLALVAPLHVAPADERVV
jgi:hypothetical protein